MSYDDELVRAIAGSLLAPYPPDAHTVRIVVGHSQQQVSQVHLDDLVALDPRLADVRRGQHGKVWHLGGTSVRVMTCYARKLLLGWRIASAAWLSAPPGHVCDIDFIYELTTRSEG